MDVPGGAYGNDLGQIVSTVTLWATSDALATIEQIEALDVSPADAAARRALAKDEQMLGGDRARALADMEGVDQLLHTRLPALQLAAVAGTGAAG